MRMGRRTVGGLVLAIAATAIGAGAQPAGAADPLPVGEAFGVRIAPQGRAMTVVFTREARALARRISGRRISVWCERGDKGVGEPMDVDRGQTRLRMPNYARGKDYCRIEIERRVDGDSETLVSIPLTQAGAVQLDEEIRALTVWALLDGAALTRRDARFPSPERLLATVRAERDPFGLVALASPTDTPPAGTVGYWSDGAEHAVAVALTATGRRLFVELLPGREVRTNVLGIVLDSELY